jgi:hypothetical protein
MSTDKFCEQVVPLKNLVVRQKVSLRVIARERVARLQMIPRRVVREKKCPQGKVSTVTSLISPIFRQSFEGKSAEYL